MSYKTETVSVARLRERLFVDANGVLRWRVAPDLPKQWNTVWAGREAFTAVDGKGYRHGSLDKKYFRLHRVVWALAYGAWPESEIDHIDGDRLNNDLANLRAATPSENHRNQKRSRSNRSGHTGVNWYKAYSKWRAYISSEGRVVHLGYFDTIEAAVAARAAASASEGYHANHGRSAVHV